MVSVILPLIPDHLAYVEPFFGGGAIFWAKPPSKTETINDLNDRVIRLCYVIQTDFDRFQDYIQSSLNSRALHKKAHLIYDNSHLFSDIEVAWSVWYQANFSFASKIKGGWAYDRKGSTNRKFRNRISGFDESFYERLQNVQLESNDALKVIASRDSSDTFHYIDPPYFNSNMGHYSGYTVDDFLSLMQLLSSIKGKFLMSSYPSKELSAAAKKYNWWQQKHEYMISVVKGKRDKKKVEVLTANYPI